MVTKARMYGTGFSRDRMPCVRSSLPGYSRVLSMILWSYLPISLSPFSVFLSLHLALTLFSHLTIEGKNKGSVAPGLAASDQCECSTISYDSSRGACGERVGHPLPRVRFYFICCARRMSCLTPLAATPTALKKGLDIFSDYQHTVFRVLVDRGVGPS